MPLVISANLSPLFSHRRNVVPAAVYEDVRYTPSRQVSHQRRGYELTPAGFPFDKEGWNNCASSSNSLSLSLSSPASIPHRAHQSHLQPSNLTKKPHLQAPGKKMSETIILQRKTVTFATKQKVPGYKKKTYHSCLNPI